MKFPFYTGGIYMDETLNKYFNRLDEDLKELGMSDSAVEYAPHQREPFDKIIKDINEIKAYLGGLEILRKSDWYFE